MERKDVHDELRQKDHTVSPQEEKRGNHQYPEGYPVRAPVGKNSISATYAPEAHQLSPVMSTKEIQEKVLSHHSKRQRSPDSPTMSHKGIPLSLSTSERYLRPSQTVKFPRAGPYRDPSLINGVLPWSGGQSRKGTYMRKLHRLGSPTGRQITPNASNSKEELLENTPDDSVLQSPKLAVVAALGDIEDLLRQRPEIAKSLRKITLPPRDPTFIRVDESRISLSMFDDDTFETLVDPSAIIPEELGKSPLYQNHRWEWKLVHVLSYNSDNGRYMVRFSGSSKIKAVERLDLCLLREDVRNFQQRLLVALYKREQFKIELRKQYLVDTHPDLDTESVSVTTIFRILLRLFSASFPRPTLSRANVLPRKPQSAMTAFNWFNPVIPQSIKIFFFCELKGTEVEEGFEIFLQTLLNNVKTKNPDNNSTTNFIDNVSSLTSRKLLQLFYLASKSKSPKDVSHSSTTKKAVEQLFFKHVIGNLCTKSKAIASSIDEASINYVAAAKTSALHTILKEKAFRKDEILQEAKLLNIQPPDDTRNVPMYGKLQIPTKRFYRYQVKIANSIKVGDVSVVKCMLRLSETWRNQLSACSLFAYKPPLLPCCNASEIGQFKEGHRGNVHTKLTTTQLLSHLASINSASLLRLKEHDREDAVFSLTDSFFPLSLEQFILVQREHMKRVCKVVLVDLPRDAANVLSDRIVSDRYDFFVNTKAELQKNDVTRLLRLIDEFLKSSIHNVWVRSLANFSGMFQQYLHHYPENWHTEDAFDRVHPLISMNFAISEGGGRQWKKLHDRGWITSPTVLTKELEVDPESGFFCFQSKTIDPGQTQGQLVQINNCPTEVLGNIAKILHDAKRELKECYSISSLSLAIPSIIEDSALVSLDVVADDDNSIEHWISPWNETLTSVTECIKGLLQPALKSARDIHNMCWVLDLDAEDIFKTVYSHEDSLPVQHIFSLVRQLERLKRNAQEMGVGEKRLGFVRLSVSAVLNQIVEAATTTRRLLMEKLATKATEAARQLHKSFEDIEAELKLLPNNEEELKAQRKYLENLPKVLNELQVEIDSLLDFMHGSEEFHYKMKPENFELFWTLVSRPSDVLDAQKACNLVLSQEKNKMISSIDKEKQQFVKDLNRLETKVEGFCRSADPRKVIAIVDEANQIDYQLRTLSENATDFAKRDKDLGFTPSNYSTLTELHTEFESAFKTWTTLAEFQSNSQQWMNSLLQEIDLEMLRKETEDATNLADYYLTHEDESNESTRVASKELQKSTKPFVELMPLLDKLLSSKMQDHHLELLRDKTKLNFLGTENATLANLMESNVLQHQEHILEVFSLAQSEQSLIDTHANIVNYWQKKEFPLLKPANLECPILGNCRELIGRAEEDLVSLQKIICSPYSWRFRNECLELQKTLRTVHTITPMLLETQRQWIYCAEIVGNRFLMQHLPNAKKVFKASDRSFRNALSDVTDNPEVTKMADNEHSLGVLRESKSQFRKVKEAVLEELCQLNNSSPRLGFLSPDDLISFYYFVSEPSYWSTFVAKCFQGISRIHFRKKAHTEESTFVDAIGTCQTALGWLPLNECLASEMFVHNVGEFIHELDTASRRSLLKLTQAAISSFENFELRIWVDRWPLQPCLLAMNVLCTQMISDILQNSQGLDDVRNKLSSLQAEITQSLATMQCSRLKTQALFLTLSRYLEILSMKDSLCSGWESAPKYWCTQDGFAVGFYGIEMPHGLSILDGECSLQLYPITERCIFALSSAFRRHQTPCLFKSGDGTTHQALIDAAGLCGYESWTLNLQTSGQHLKASELIKSALLTKSWTIVDVDYVEEQNLWHCVADAYEMFKNVSQGHSGPTEVDTVATPRLFFLSNSQSTHSVNTYVIDSFRSLSLLLPPCREIVVDSLRFAGSQYPFKMEKLLNHFVDIIQSLSGGTTFNSTDSIMYFLIRKLFCAHCVDDWDATVKELTNILSLYFSEAPYIIGTRDFQEQDSLSTDSTADVLKKKGLSHNGAFVEQVGRISLSLQEVLTTVIYGGALSGKTTIFNAAIDTLREQGKNMKVASIKWSAVAEIIPALENIQEYLEARNNSRRVSDQWVLKIDCGEGQGDEVDRILKEAEHVFNKHKICVETISLQNLSPSAIPKLRLTYVDGCHFTWLSVVQSSLQLDKGMMHKLQRLLEKILPITCSVINTFPKMKNFISMEQLTILWIPLFAQLVELYKSRMGSPKWMEKACFHSIINVAFLFVESEQRVQAAATIESICLGKASKETLSILDEYSCTYINDEGKSQYSGDNLDFLVAEIPKGTTLLDLFFDYETGILTLTKSLGSSAAFVNGQLYIPRNCDVLAKNVTCFATSKNKSVIVSGENGTSSFLRWLDILAEKKRGIFVLDASFTIPELAEVATLYHKNLHSYCLVPKDSEPVTLLVDDFNMAGSVSNSQIFSFFRGIMEDKSVPQTFQKNFLLASIEQFCMIGALAAKHISELDLSLLHHNAILSLQQYSIKHEQSIIFNNLAGQLYGLKLEPNKLEAIAAKVADSLRVIQSIPLCLNQSKLKLFFINLGCLQRMSLVGKLSDASQTVAETQAVFQNYIALCGNSLELTHKLIGQIESIFVTADGSYAEANLSKVDVDSLEKYKSHYESMKRGELDSPKDANWFETYSLQGKLYPRAYLQRISSRIKTISNDFKIDVLVRHFQLSNHLREALASSVMQDDSCLIWWERESDATKQMEKIVNTLKIGTKIVVGLNISNNDELSTTIQAFRHALHVAAWNLRNANIVCELKVIAFEVVTDSLDTELVKHHNMVIVDASPDNDEKLAGLRQELSDEFATDEMINTIANTQTVFEHTGKEHRHICSLVCAYKRCLMYINETILHRQESLKNLLEQLSTLGVKIAEAKENSEEAKARLGTLRKDIKQLCEKIEYADTEVEELNEQTQRIDKSLQEGLEEFELTKNETEELKQEEAAIYSSLQQSVKPVTKQQFVSMKKIKGGKAKVVWVCTGVHVLVVRSEDKVDALIDDKTICAETCKADTFKSLKSLDLSALSEERINKLEKHVESVPVNDLEDEANKGTVEALTEWILKVHEGTKVVSKRKVCEANYLALRESREAQTKALGDAKAKLELIYQDAQGLQKTRDEQRVQVETIKRNSADADKRSGLCSEILAKADAVKDGWQTYIDNTNTISQFPNSFALVIALYITQNLTWEQCVSYVYEKNESPPSKELLDEFLYNVWDSQGTAYIRWGAEIDEQLRRCLLSSAIGMLPILENVTFSHIADMRNVLTENRTLNLWKGDPWGNVNEALLSTNESMFAFDCDEHSYTSNFAPFLDAIDGKTARFTGGTLLKLNPKISYFAGSTGVIVEDLEDPRVHIVSKLDDEYDFTREVIRVCSQQTHFQRKKTQTQFQLQRTEYLKREVAMMETVTGEIADLSVPALDRLLEKISRVVECNAEVSQLQELKTRQKSSTKRYCPLASQMQIFLHCINWLNCKVNRTVFHREQLVDILSRLTKEKQKEGMELRELLLSLSSDLPGHTWASIRMSVQPEVRIFWDLKFFLSIAKEAQVINSEEVETLVDKATGNDIKEDLPIIKSVKTSLDKLEGLNKLTSIDDLVITLRKHVISDGESAITKTTRLLVAALMQDQWNHKSLVVTILEDYFQLKSFTPQVFLCKSGNNNFPILIETNPEHSHEVVRQLIGRVNANGEHPPVTSYPWSKWSELKDKLVEANKSPWVVVYGLDSTERLNELLTLLETMKKERTHENFRLIFTCNTLKTLPTWLLQQTTVCCGCIEEEFGGLKSVTDVLGVPKEDRTNVDFAKVMAGIVLCKFNLNRSCLPSFHNSVPTAKLESCWADIEAFLNTTKNPEISLPDVVAQFVQINLSHGCGNVDSQAVHMVIKEWCQQAESYHQEDVINLKNAFTLHDERKNTVLSQKLGIVHPRKQEHSKSISHRSAHVLRTEKGMPLSFLRIPIGCIVAERYILSMQRKLFKGDAQFHTIISELVPCHDTEATSAVANAGLEAVSGSLHSLVTGYASFDEGSLNLLASESCLHCYRMLNANNQSYRPIILELKKQSSDCSNASLFNCTYIMDTATWLGTGGNVEADAGSLQLCFSSNEDDYYPLHFPCPVYRRVQSSNGFVLLYYGTVPMRTLESANLEYLLQSRPAIVIYD